MGEETSRTGGWQLCPLLPADAPDLHQIELAVFPGEAWSEALLADELALEWSYYLGAQSTELGQELLGYGGVRVLETEAEIMTLGVLPDARQKGIGRALTTALLQHCRDQGVRQVFLEVRAGNEAALALYRDLGFKIIDRRRRYYRNPEEDAAIMRLWLR